MSQDRTLTQWHTDFSGTSVCYVLVSGAKTFYVVRPTDRNLRICRKFLQDRRKNLFLGNHPDLDDGGCRSINLLAGQAVIMPANTIHMVTTTGLGVALGMNFIHVGQIHNAGVAHAMESQERVDNTFDHCYPHFATLAIAYLARRM